MLGVDIWQKKNITPTHQGLVLCVLGSTKWDWGVLHGSSPSDLSKVATIRTNFNHAKCWSFSKNIQSEFAWFSIRHWQKNMMFLASDLFGVRHWSKCLGWWSLKTSRWHQMTSDAVWKVQKLKHDISWPSFQHLSTSFNIFQHLSTSFNIFQHLSTSFNIFQHLSTSFNIFQHLSTSFNIFQHLSTPFNTFQHLSTPFNTFQHLSTSFNIFQHLSTSFNIFQHLSTSFNIFQHLSTSFNPRLLTVALRWIGRATVERMDPERMDLGLGPKGRCFCQLYSSTIHSTALLPWPKLWAQRWKKWPAEQPLAGTSTRNEFYGYPWLSNAIQINAPLAMDLAYIICPTPKTLGACKFGTPR